MRPQVKPSEDGYSLWGLEPDELRQSSGFFRKMFWSWVVEFGLREKDRDLARGLDKDGKPLKPIDEETRKHRKSAMTPSGKGDPNAPPLTPGWQKSRTRSLLDGKAFADHAEFWWRFDPNTHASWARILDHQVEQGRDVFGLSPDALRRTRVKAVARWNSYKAGRYDEPEPKPTRRTRQPKPEVIAGSTDIRGKTAAEWQHYFRQTAKAAVPGRPAKPKTMSPISGPRYNRTLAHIYGIAKSIPKRTPIVVARPIAAPIGTAAPSWMKLR